MLCLPSSVLCGYGVRPSLEAVVEEAHRSFIAFYPLGVPEGTLSGFVYQKGIQKHSESNPKHIKSPPQLIQLKGVFVSI